MNSPDILNSAICFEACDSLWVYNPETGGIYPGVHHDPVETPGPNPEDEPEYEGTWSIILINGEVFQVRDQTLMFGQDIDPRFPVKTMSNAETFSKIETVDGKTLFVQFRFLVELDLEGIKNQLARFHALSLVEAEESEHDDARVEFPQDDSADDRPDHPLDSDD